MSSVKQYKTEEEQLGAEVTMKIFIQISQLDTKLSAIPEPHIRKQILISYNKLKFAFAKSMDDVQKAMVKSMSQSELPQ